MLLSTRVGQHRCLLNQVAPRDQKRLRQRQVSLCYVLELEERGSSINYGLEMIARPCELSTYFALDFLPYLGPVCSAAGSLNI